MEFFKNLSVSVLLLLLFLPALTQAKSLNRESDPKNLITFAIPEGWELRKKDFRTNLQLKGPKNPARIRVGVTMDAKATTLKKRRKQALRAFETQGFKVDKDRVSWLKGYQSWEVLATTKSGFKAHYLYLYRAKQEICVEMTAKPDVHEKRKGDLASLARSIRVR